MHDPAADNTRYYDQFAHFYDLFFDDFERSMEEEGEWLERVLGEPGTRTVLDACCGTGRQAIPLSRRGYQVTAVDPCAAMLDRTIAGARIRRLELDTRCGRFTDLPGLCGSEFDVVIALGNGLCQQERAQDILASLRAMRSCCRTPGLCLIGIKDFDMIQQEGVAFHGHRVRAYHGTRTMLFEIWERLNPLLLITTYLVWRIADGRWQLRTAQTREYMLTASELAALAMLAGFTSCRRLAHPTEAVYLLDAE